MHCVKGLSQCFTALTRRLEVYSQAKRFATWYKHPKDYEPPQIYPFKRMRGPRRLGASLLKIFPDKDIYQRPKQLGEFKNPTTGERYELEFYIPELKLAFEYQDPHKFAEAWHAARCPLTFQWRDDVKRKVITDKGETLITIPCWWDGNIESLKASIHVRRPELLPPGQKIRIAPIMLMSPPMYFNVNIVPEIGEMMLASFALSTQFDGTNWLMGEKYDGVRACWNPLVHKLYSRNGKELSIPRKFMKAFPDIFLDSEIWFGRGCFGDSLAISSHAHKNLVAWGLIRWVSFDCPNPFIQKTYTFEERYEQLLLNVPVQHHFLLIASRVLCYSQEHLLYNADEIVSDDGEGLMCRTPQSPYVNGRTDLLIKIKAERDQEGFITTIDSRTAVTLTGPDGRTFAATIPPDYPKDDPVKEGDIVTFCFNTLTKDGKPNRAQIVRKRHDCTWSEIVEVYHKDLQTEKDKKEKEKEKPKKGRKK